LEWAAAFGISRAHYSPARFFLKELINWMNAKWPSIIIFPGPLWPLKPLRFVVCTRSPWRYLKSRSKTNFELLNINTPCTLRGSQSAVLFLVHCFDLELLIWNTEFLIPKGRRAKDSTRLLVATLEKDAWHSLIGLQHVFSFFRPKENEFRVSNHSSDHYHFIYCWTTEAHHEASRIKPRTISEIPPLSKLQKRRSATSVSCLVRPWSSGSSHASWK
jgi:hypothetical protein